MTTKNKMATDALAMAEVLSVRLPMLAMYAVNPTATRQREAVRMVTEKMMAAAMGTMAAQLYLSSMPFRMMAGASAQDVMDDMVEAYLAPGRKTLRANARRLSAKRRV